MEKCKIIVFIFNETLPEDSSTIFLSRHKSGKPADFLFPEIVDRADESHFGRAEMRRHDLPAVVKFLQVHRGVSQHPYGTR
jgi:hypothetical protein